MNPLNSIKIIYRLIRKNLHSGIVLGNRRVKLWFADEKGLFLADDGNMKFYFARARRCSLYYRGISRRLNGLAQNYWLDTITLSAAGKGVLIDCGANVGELGFWARQNGMDYIAFEPEAAEARCCDLNNYNGEAKTHRKALWKETTNLTFYSKPNSADGSIIPAGNEDTRFEIDAVALDDIIDLSDTPGTVILKVEAEGAEPEVLTGAKNTLPQVDWVTVDCGPERGIHQEPTFVAVNNILSAAGFRLHSRNPHRLIALYQNTTRAVSTNTP